MGYIERGIKLAADTLAGASTRLSDYADQRTTRRRELAELNSTFQSINRLLKTEPAAAVLQGALKPYGLGANCIVSDIWEKNGDMWVLAIEFDKLVVRNVSGREWRGFRRSDVADGALDPNAIREKIRVQAEHMTKRVMSGERFHSNNELPWDPSLGSETGLVSMMSAGA